MRFRFLSAALAIAALGGCSSGPGGMCTSIAPVPQLVAPVSGATGVSDTLASLTLQGAFGGDTITVRSSAGTLAGVGAVVNNSVSLPALAPATTYTVHATYPAGCGSNSSTSSADIGTFTTQ